MSVDRDFFVSFTGADRPLAQWLLAELDTAGYSSVSQLRDFVAGGNFTLAMDQAARRARLCCGRPQQLHRGGRLAEGRSPAGACAPVQVHKAHRCARWLLTVAGAIVCARPSPKVRTPRSGQVLAPGRDLPEGDRADPVMAKPVDEERAEGVEVPGILPATSAERPPRTARSR